MASGRGDDGLGPDFRPPPLPDDRIWRHPSELASPGPAAAPGNPPRVWPVAAAAVLLGAGLTFAVVEAAAEREAPPAAIGVRELTLVPTTQALAMSISTSAQPCWLGVAGVDADGGALLDEVQPGSPAAQAGLAPGDVVVAMGGAPVRTIGELQANLHRWSPGDLVRVVFRRAGERHAVDVVLGARSSE